jgi:two-component system, NarL family, captular synthesis response regulator RcsB
MTPLAILPLTTAIADRHPLVRYALRHLLENELGLRIVHDCAGAPDLFECLRQRPVDLIVADLIPPTASASGNLELLRRVQRGHPAGRVVLVTSQENAQVLAHASQLGIRGLVSRMDHHMEILHACRHAAHESGACYLSPSVRLALTRDGRRPVSLRLTRKELEVVRLVAAGHALIEIGRLLNRSPSTISTQKASAMDKLGLASTAGLIRYAYDCGLI